MNVSFANPWMLHLLWLPLAAGVLLAGLRARSRRRLRRFAAPAMLAQLCPPENALRSRTAIALCVTALLLTVLALARPQWGERALPVRDSGRRIMAILDVSRSMLAEDVHPNRLERAKADLHDLADALPHDRLGLIALRNGAQLLCPLTRDLSFFKHALHGADLHAAPPGPTHIGDALRLALRSLDDALEVRAIVLFSDGEDLQDDALQAAETVREQGIPVFCVGIGSAAGARIPDEAGGFLHFEGREVLTRMEPETLRRIAEITGGTLVRIGAGSTIRGDTLGRLIHQHLDARGARQQRILLEARRIERHPLFLIPATLMLLLAALSSAGRPAGRPAGRRPGLALLAGCLLWQGATANGDAPWPADSGPVAAAAATDAAPTPARGTALRREAERRFAEGRFEDAARAFLDAARAFDPRRAEACRYNAALALYHAGRLEESEPLLRELRAARHPLRDAVALHGRLLLDRAAQHSPSAHAARIHDLEESTAALQAAARMTPGDTALRQTLAAAVEQLGEARREAHIHQLMETHGQQPPTDLLTRMLQHQHDIDAQVRNTDRTDAEQWIRDYEASSDRQREAGDLWVPLKQHLLQHPGLVTNPMARAALSGKIEHLRDTMQENVERLRDLEPDARERGLRIRNRVLPLWQDIAPPPALLDIAIPHQAHALDPADPAGAAESQRISRALTGRFADRFPEWADAVNDPAATTGEAPPLSDETIATIRTLATQALQHQDRAIEQLDTHRPASADPEAALELLERIRELLPRPPPEESAEPDESQEPPESEPESEPATDTPDMDETGMPDTPRDPDDAETDTEDAAPPDVERLLERAADREREHAEDQRRRARTRPPPDGVRDW